MAPWDTVLQSTAKLHNDPSLASFPSIPPSSMGNVLEQEHTIYGDLLTGKRDLTEEEESSRSFQPSWQVHTVIFIVYLPVPSVTIRPCLFSSLWFDNFNLRKLIQCLKKYWCKDIFEIFMSLYSLLSLSWKLGTMHFNKTKPRSFRSSCAFSPNHLMNGLWPITPPYNQISQMDFVLVCM